VLQSGGAQSLFFWVAHEQAFPIPQFGQKLDVRDHGGHLWRMFISRTRRGLRQRRIPGFVVPPGRRSKSAAISIPIGAVSASTSATRSIVSKRLGQYIA